MLESKNVLLLLMSFNDLSSQSHKCIFNIRIYHFSFVDTISVLWNQDCFAIRRNVCEHCNLQSRLHNILRKLDTACASFIVLNKRMCGK